MLVNIIYKTDENTKRGYEYHVNFSCETDYMHVYCIAGKFGER